MWCEYWNKDYQLRLNVFSKLVLYSKIGEIIHRNSEVGAWPELNTYNTYNLYFLLLVFSNSLLFARKFSRKHEVDSKFSPWRKVLKFSTNCISIIMEKCKSIFPQNSTSFHSFANAFVIRRCTSFPTKNQNLL